MNKKILATTAAISAGIGGCQAESCLKTADPAEFVRTNQISMKEKLTWLDDQKDLPHNERLYLNMIHDLQEDQQRGEDAFFADWDIESMVDGCYEANHDLGIAVYGATDYIDYLQWGVSRAALNGGWVGKYEDARWRLVQEFYSRWNGQEDDVDWVRQNEAMILGIMVEGGIELPAFSL